MNGELPKGWVWTSLGNICTIQGGYAFKSKEYQEKGIPLLRITNIYNSKIIFENKDNVYLDENYLVSLDRYVVKRHDILIALSGVNTGKIGIYELDHSSLLNQRVGRLNFHSPLYSYNYVLHYLEHIRNDVLKKTYGAAQPNISTIQLEIMKIPLPPLAEQKRIVNKIEELFTNLDKGVESLEQVKYKLKVYRDRKSVV